MMDIDHMRTELRVLGMLVTLTVGVALGAAVPALVEAVAATTSSTRGTEEIAPAVGSEWAVPPSHERRGEPY